MMLCYHGRVWLRVCQNFYKEMKRDEIYIRYIYSLAQLQKDSGNYVEAGFTLLLHAELLQVWGGWLGGSGVGGEGDPLPAIDG